MLDDSWHAVTDFSAVYITVVNHKSLAHWKFFILCFLKKFILSPYLSMVVLMLSIRVGGRVGGGGGGGGLSSPVKPTCTSLFLHYWSLNCCHVALALICQAMVALYAIGNLVNRH